MATYGDTKANGYLRTDSGISSSASQVDMLRFDVLAETTDDPYESIAVATETTSASTDQPIENGWKAKFRRLFPPRGPAAKWFTWLIVCLLLFGVVWSLYPHRMVPGKNLFGVSVTFLLCLASEVLIIQIPTPQGIPPIPQLLASLLMGLALANLPAPVNVASYIDPHWSFTLRTMALAVILTRAGLELDPEAMKRVKWAVIRLAFLPCIAETTAIGIFGHLILGFPFLWSFMMGFMIAAVSPAVVIPSLILLQEKGLGRDKGVPSLVMAASGIDDVLAIAGFTVLLGIAMPNKLEDNIVSVVNMMSTSEQTTLAPPITTESYIQNMTTATQQHEEFKIGLEIAGAIVEVVIGVFAGIVCGLFISYIPHRSMTYKNFCRGALLLGTGIFAVFSSDYWGIPGSGALWALITSFIASLNWKEDCKPLEKAWHYMWVIFQPLLFGLTGATVDVNMMDGETVGLGLAVLGIGLIFRSMVSSTVTWGLELKKKEKLFVSIAWIPKGTVQAALGSAALDTALALNRPEHEVRWGEQILVLAVLVTLITAPIGAFGIGISGPRLLGTTQLHGTDNEAYSPDSGVSDQPMGNGLSFTISELNTSSEKEKTEDEHTQM